ncbi:alpha/beta hydrolase [soil metagenome]
MSVPRTLTIPSGVVVRTIETDRGSFAAHETIPEGETRGHLLLIPGWTGSKEDFTQVLPLLAAQGWHVTAYDQRGQFESPGKASDDYSLSGFAADALAVRATSGHDKSHLLGHSFGGLVAQTAAVAAPDTWSSLSLLCTGPGALGDSESRPLTMFAAAIDQVGLAKLHQIREQLAGGDHPLQIAKFLAKRFIANSPASLKAMTQLLLTTTDGIDAVAALPMPKWVARGRRDDAWPHDVQAEMARRLGVEIVIIENAAHSPAVEDPATTAAYLGTFLDSTLLDSTQTETHRPDTN